MPRPGRLTLRSKNALLALESLRINVTDIERDQITPDLVEISRELKLRHPDFPDLVHVWPDFLAASDAPEAKVVRGCYHSVSGSRLRRSLPIEAYCAAAHVSPIRILEIITAICVRRGAHASTIIAAVSHPRVVSKTIDDALNDPDGSVRGHAQDTLHKATGFLPTPKSAQTNITVTQNASANAATVQAVAAPVPEQTIRRLADRFNESRALPQSPTLEVVPDRMPYQDAESVLSSVEEDE